MIDSMLRPPGATTSPAELMERYQRGDMQSFRELYAVMARPLLGYLVKLSRSPALADDLLQLTFLKVHRSRAAYIRGADPVPWIYTIAHRTFLDEFRRSRSTIVAAAGEHLPDIVADLRGGTADRSDDERADPELARAAVVALATLPSQQREAIVMTKLEGKSVAEAAKLARTSTCALRGRVHRGYLALRALLATHEATRAAA